MKHILPILTLALLGVAATASAADAFDYYDDNYGYYSIPYDDYQVAPGIKTQTINYDKYQVIKTAYESDDSLEYQSRFRIHVNGDSSTKVDFFLYDFYDNAQDGTNASSLADQGITQIGYRLLDSKNGLAPIGEGDFRSLGVGKEETVVKPNASIYDTTPPVELTRNKYYLGTFTGGTDFEIYMSRSDVADSGVWSYSSVDDQVAGYLGGAGLSENILELNVDKLMMAYQAGQTFSFDATNPTLIKEAAAAMPLAWLSPTGGGVSFGIQSKIAAGHPLPGGLPIALIAGLFGLGFWYIRRRKAVAA